MLELAELQLVELLEDRPNQTKPRKRRRNKLKDLQKMARRGDGLYIKERIWQKRYNQALSKQLKERKEETFFVQIVSFTPLEEVIILEQMLSQKEIQEKYPNSHVTQNNISVKSLKFDKLNGRYYPVFENKIQLIQKQYRWGVFIKSKSADYPYYSWDKAVMIRNKYNSLQPLENKEFPIDDLANELSYYLDDSQVTNVLRDIYVQAKRLKLNEIKEEIEENSGDYLTERDKKFFSLIDSFQE